MKNRQNILTNLTPDDLFNLLENLPIAVFAKNAKDQFRFIFWNKFAENIFGINRNEILDKTDFDLFDEKLAYYYRKTDEYVFLQKDIVDVPLEEIMTPSGIKYAHTKKIPIFDQNGLPSILVGVLDDITESIENNQKRIELIQSLEEKNKELKHLVKLNTERSLQLEKTKDELENILKEKDVFLQIIAHDLRNPVSSILPFLEILYHQSDSISKDDIKQITSVLLETTQNFRQLLENLLEWAMLKTQTGDIFQMNLDINNEIEKTINLLKLNIENKHQKINSNLTATKLVKCERNMLQTILRNLLSNAVKFSPMYSTIIIDSIDSSNEVKICFTNPGDPISQETISAVFRSQTVKSKPGTSGERGSGLGLLLIKEYIIRNNGKLHIEGIPNLGTKITFSLPTYDYD